MAKRLSRTAAIRSDLSGNWQLYLLLFLLTATFAMGGGSRGDITSLVLLRPIAAICFGLGLLGLKVEQIRHYRVPFGFLAAITGAILLHLIPLPPSIWGNLPGREIALEATRLAGLESVWRPVSLVPYRGWNALYAMLVPAAAMVLAAQVPHDKQRRVLQFVLFAALVAVLLGIAQASSGFNPALYLYDVTNLGSPVGLFANRNHFSAFLCIAIPALSIIASQADHSRRSFVIGLCAGGAFILLLMILASGSRGGLVFSLLGLAFAWALWSVRASTTKRRKVGRTWLAPAIAVAFCVVVAVFLAVIFARAEALERVSANTASEDLRFETWAVVARNLFQYWPVGSGFGSFVEVFQIHEPASMLNVGYWNHAHNDSLEWLLEGGVPIAAVLGVAVVAYTRQTAYLWRNRRMIRSGIQLSLFGAFVILILGLWSLLDYPLRVPSLSSLAAIGAVWMFAPRAMLGERSQRIGKRGDLSIPEPTRTSEVRHGFD